MGFFDDTANRGSPQAIGTRSPHKSGAECCVAELSKPFNPETWIPYHLAEPSEVTVRIYTASGTLIRTLALGHRSAGTSTNKRSDAIYWDGKNDMGEPVSSGVYFYILTARRVHRHAENGDSEVGSDLE